MTLSLKHTFNSAKTDGSDATLIQPSAWNSEHTITLDATTIVGNISGSTAAAAALTPAQGRYVLNAASSEAASYLGLCVNPFMEISQQNGTNAVAGGGYGIDQWTSYYAGTMAYTAQQVSNPFSATAGYKRFRNGLQYKITTAQGSLGSSDQLEFYQPIEGTFFKGLGWDTTDASSIDLVAVVSSSVSGTFSFFISSSASNQFFAKPITLTANTPTVVFFTIPGPSAGTWATDTGGAAVVGVALSSGSGLATANNAWGGQYVSGQTNLAATLNATFTIAYLNVFPTGVLPYTSAAQVDLTHLANMRRPYDDELRRCQRYYQTYNIYGYGYAQSSGPYRAAVIRLLASPRVSPTFSYVNMTYSNCSAITTDGVSGAYVNVTAVGSYFCDGFYIANARM